MLDQSGIKEILENARKIAVVGLSPREERPSNRVARYLLAQGYEIIPVNPGYQEILGIKTRKSLAEIKQGEVDIIDVFRRSEEVGEFLEDAIRIAPKLFWLQEGIVNDAVVQKLEEAGIPAVQNLCIMKEHIRLFDVRG